MALTEVADFVALARQRDRAIRDYEQMIEDAAAEAVKLLLARMRSRSTVQSLTASNVPRRVSDMFTLGEINGWWQEALDEQLVGPVIAAWNAGHADTSTVRHSAEAGGEYLARVKDRLSRTATPTLPEQAFDKVRQALAEETGRGSSIRDVSRRLGAELQWQGEDVPFWQSRQREAEQRIGAILDPLGEPGSPSREFARLNDPEVREWQQRRSNAVLHLDRDRSEWETRATRIARTETTGAYNAGAQEALNREGAPYKRWVATLDERTRESHQDAHGQCVPRGERFEVGGERLNMPGDPDAPPGEVVNCRCTMVGSRDCDGDMLAPTEVV